MAGCGKDHDRSAPRTSTTSSTTTTTAAPTSSTEATGTTAAPTTSRAPAPTAPAPATVSLTDGDDGRAIAVRRGDHVVVVLHSTYWTFTSPSGGVLQAEGSPTVAPQLQGCVPGGGCGTVTARYLATAAGQATLRAHRDSCGEALACTGGAGDWQVQVTVR